MTDIELIELARAYVALSNAHRPELIQPLFANDAVYRSSAVGEHRGATAIVEMMRGFFTRYPDVHWQCRHYRRDGERVSFDFELIAAATDDASELKRSGLEYIEFDERGLIKALEVKVA